MPFAYTKMSLDRCSNERKNKTWLNAQFARADTLFCVINDGLCLFKLDEITPLYLPKSQLTTITIQQCIFLGKSNQGAVFAIEHNKLRFSEQEALMELGQWLPLRQHTAILSAFDAGILALAKGLVHWHTSHQFCGKCGNANRSAEAGHARKCTGCRSTTFPRTDPAVIMLVEKMFNDGVARCLLGRQATWPEGVYSTLAGFVDPGETLESAVIREVLEESTILAKNPTYVASQPWPFPASIMLGFTAEAHSEAIDTSQDSLEQAQWFSREELANFAVNRSVINTVAALQKSDKIDNQSLNKEPQYKMSSSDSISSYLIKAWLNKDIGRY